MTGTLDEDHQTFLIISRPVLLRIRNVPDKSCRENQNKYFRLKKFFLIVPFMRYMAKYCTGGQATDENTVHAHYKCTIRISITYCFYTVTMVYKRA